MYQFPWNMMATKSQPFHNNNYVSCIRFKGVPILPPVMTEDRIIEMKKFKQLAIDVETRLKLKKELKILSQREDFDQPPSSFNDSTDNFIGELQVPENNVTFIEESSTLNVPENSPNTESINEIDIKNNDSDETFSSIQSKNSVTNSFNEHDVPVNDSIPGKPLELENQSDILKENSKVNADFNLNCPECVSSPPTLSNNRNSDDENREKTENNVPRLLRQNSYIIETPSPMLLAYIDSQSKVDDSQSNQSSNSESKERRRSCWDLINAREKWSSLEKDINAAAFTPIQRKINSNKKNSSLPSSVPVSPAKQMFDSKTPKQKEKPPNSSSKTRREKPNRNGFRTPQSAKCRRPNNDSLKPKLIKSRSFIVDKKTSTTSSPKFSKPNNVTQSIQVPPDNIRSVNEISKIEKPEMEEKAKELYLAIQYEHSRLMKELMIRYKKEQENLIRRFNEQHMLILNQLKMSSSTPTLEYLSESLTQRSENTERTDCIKFSARDKHFDNLSSINGTNLNNTFETGDNPDLSARKLEEEFGYSDCTSSQTLNLNLSTTPSAMVDLPHDIITMENIQNIDRNNYAEMEIIQNDQYIPLSNLQNGNNNYIHHQAVQIVYSSNNEMPTSASKISNCNRELFPVKNKLIQAVTVIQAGIRGYLVRRLLHTERVQSLITTIRDTLLCALELQREDINSIQPADVELHRCLINQMNVVCSPVRTYSNKLTAACYGIHDIFFTLTIPERMTVIALDRQKLHERLLRPSSARSTPSLTTTTKKFLERKHLKSASSSMVSEISSQSMKRLCKSSNGNSDLFSGSPNSRRNVIHSNSNKRPWR